MPSFGENQMAHTNIASKDIKSIEVSQGAIMKLFDFLDLHSFHRPAVITDPNTFEAAGKMTSDHFSDQGKEFTQHILHPNEHGQVIADEQTIMQLFVEIPDDTDVMIAVGSGTIHDIVRFVSYKTNKSFISVPTAASVDGFTSRGAPLILKGVKQTVQCMAPMAVFADLNILVKAPAEMTAAGFGDMLGKYTSLVDWKISHLIGQEPYDQHAADLTKEALESCVSHVHEIANRDAQGIKILMQSLIQSGLVMLKLGYSRPASGGEHHLSHYWEMDLLKSNQRQLLHGAKVGVATVLIAELYKEKFKELKQEDLSRSSRYERRVCDNLNDIQNLIESLPEPKQLKSLLRMVGGPSVPEELGISKTLVESSLQEAYHLRNRCTGLFLINQFASDRMIFPFDVRR